MMKYYLKLLLFIPLIILSIGLISCGGSDSSSDPSSTSEVQFNVSDAVAILKKSNVNAASVNSGTSPSNLVKLTSSGNIEDVIETTNNVTVSHFYIAPDGKLYVIFSSPVQINGQSCIFASISQSNNESVCIDDELQSITTFNYACAFPTPPVQFDDDGNIYYAGTSSTGETVLRKYNVGTGEATDLINDNIYLKTFLVNNDGTIYIAGSTTSTQVGFLRKLPPNQSLETLLSGADIQSLYEMPDGNIYAGDWGSLMGVLRIVNGSIDNTLLINDSGQQNDADFYTDNNIYDSCTNANRPKYDWFCGFNGTILSYYYRSPDNRFFVVAGCGDAASLWQYYPTVQPIDTSVLRPTVVKGTMTTLLIAGYDNTNLNKLISYNTSDESEIDLLNGADIEIYHFNYSANSGLILFDGLRFSDNTYIVGTIDTQNGNQLTVLDSGVEYDDIQFFN